MPFATEIGTALAESLTRQGFGFISHDPLAPNSKQRDSYANMNKWKSNRINAHCIQQGAQTSTPQEAEHSHSLLTEREMTKYPPIPICFPESERNEQKTFTFLLYPNRKKPQNTTTKTHGK